ncbi:hypothetical protein RYX36_019266 [Vicia faba]
MEFVKVANGGTFHSSLYNRIISSIIHSASSAEFLIDLLTSKYFKYIDVRIQVCSQPITSVAWLTTLRMLVTLSKDGNMKVWKTRVIANPNRPPMPANFFETAG